MIPISYNNAVIHFNAFHFLAADAVSCKANTQEWKFGLLNVNDKHHDER